MTCRSPAWRGGTWWPPCSTATWCSATRTAPPGTTYIPCCAPKSRDQSALPLVLRGEGVDLAPPPPRPRGRVLAGLRLHRQPDHRRHPARASALQPPATRTVLCGPPALEPRRIGGADRGPGSRER